MLSGFSSLLFTDTRTWETTQSGVSSPSEGGCAVGAVFGSQTVESSWAMMWYSFSRPGMESGGAQWSVTLVGVTSETVRERGAAGTVGKDREELIRYSFRVRSAIHWIQNEMLWSDNHLFLHVQIMKALEIDYLIQREWRQYSLLRLQVPRSWLLPRWVCTSDLGTARSRCTLVSEPGVCPTARQPPP